MRKATLSNCAQGDFLARHIVAASGVVLAGEGTKLTPRLIERFAENGIEAIWIDGDEQMEPFELDEKKAQIQRRFSAIGNDPLLREMKNKLMQALEKRAGKSDATD